MSEVMFLDQIHYWYWLILGIVCFGLELLFPGAFILWIGFAAAFTAAIAFFGLSIKAQLLFFACMSIISMLAGRKMYRLLYGKSKKETLLNRRADRLIGMKLTLSNPIINGEGRLKIEDALWSIKGPDLPVGAKIVIVAIHENALIVKERE